MGRAARRSLSRSNAEANLLLRCSGTYWASGATFSSPAFDTDGDNSTFSDTEKSDIIAIWRAVSEDYAPFDVDVRGWLSWRAKPCACVDSAAGGAL